VNVLKNLFWNNEEARLRAGYRITLQIIAYLVIMKSLFVLLGSPGEITGKTSLWIFLAIAGIRLFRGVISVWLTGRFLDHRPFSEFGIYFKKEWWKDFAFGMGLGILLMGSIFMIELSAGWISISETLHTATTGQSFSLSIIVFAVLFICVGFSEELFYRGYLLTNLAEGFNFKTISPKISIIIAITFSSVLFGFFHLGSPNASLVSTINIILAGVLFSVPYILTGSLAIPIGIHITWNFFQGNVFGFPVSGTTLPLEAVTFFSINQGGPELWTGGSFGPEAGLLSLIAFTVGIFLILGWIRFRQGRVKLHIKLAQPPMKALKNKFS
jgi:membrane protease YdiL (CAAX protease family)